MALPHSDDISDQLVRNPQGGMPRLLEIMRRLRDPKTGCPWDIEQTFSSIAPYTLEEAHEVGDAIERQAWDELPGELGDLLFQVVFHAQMARDAGMFGFDDVVKAIADKMVARHPHVFGDESRDKTPEQQTVDWEKIKAAERGAARVLDGVALGLPALTRALLSGEPSILHDIVALNAGCALYVADQASTIEAGMASARGQWVATGTAQALGVASGPPGTSNMSSQ